ncbi:MAG TPA: UPF0175 family protein [Pseudacidobacterium sp.]|nr:UPF0175 family protein [Pseudacidobacterium sp.]
MNMHFDLQVPDDVGTVLQAQYSDLSRAALEALALEGYRAGSLTESQVRRLLGFSTRMQVHAFLKEHGVHLNYSMKDLEQDITAAYEQKRSA